MIKITTKSSRIYRSLSLIVGLVIMLLAAIWEVTTAFYFFPVFALFLYLYVWKTTEKNNIPFLVFLMATMISEMLFLFNYEAFIVLISFTSVVGYGALLLLMKPILEKRVSAFSRHNTIELIVGFISVGFVVLYLSYMIIPFIPKTSLFILTLIIFIFTMSICFVIPNYNLHPDNMALYVIGGTYLAGTTFGFIYHFIFTETLMLMLSMFMIISMKITLATYITRFKKIHKEEFYNEYME